MMSDTQTTHLLMSSDGSQSEAGRDRLTPLNDIIQQKQKKGQQN